MKKIILAYRHLIVLIWLILVLLVFKLTTNFKFTNGLSLIFIFLLIIVPICFYIYIKILIKQNYEKINLNKSGYYQVLLKDINSTNFTTNLLDKLSSLNLKYLVNMDEQPTIKVINHNVEVLIIDFWETKATINIVDTNIKYNFYYSHVIDEFTKYDLRNFEYKEPIVLYTKIVEKVSELINKEYIYTCSNKKMILTTILDKKDIYQFENKKRTNDKVKKEQKVIKL